MKRIYAIVFVILILLFLLMARDSAAGSEKQSYTYEERELLATIIYNEAGCQGEQTMLYVGSVILNRVKSDRFPNSICGVIHQEGQYSTAYTPCQASDLAYEVAEKLLEGGSVLPSKVLYQHWKRPVKGTVEYCHIGKEYFSYD